MMTNGDSAKASLQVFHAEDSDDCALLLRRALKRAGFAKEPIRCKDGELAIGYLSEARDGDRPNIILLDINMPLKNGFEVLDWVRQNPRYQKTPVLMLTTSQEKEDIERARRLGATNFLQKEGTYRKLVEALEELINQSGSHAESDAPISGMRS